jgi:large subunit ribosomal protein L15
MKLHDLRPADGSHAARTRVGRGIAAGKGKTAGRGTKGQKARAGGSIPPWFEGGQTPLHMRIPKLRGFKNRARIEYEIVNVGDIAARVEAGAFATAGTTPKKGEQLTINADVLRAVGLVRDVRKPLKILGGGELTSALFVVADAFTKSATVKIVASGGTVSVLEVPAETRTALGVDGAAVVRPARVARTAAGRDAADRKVDARARRDADKAEATAEAAAVAAEKAAKPEKARKAKAAEAAVDEGDAPSSAADAPATTAQETTDVAAADAAEPVDATEGPVDATEEPADATEAPVDAPDAVVEATDESPASGDPTETHSTVPGDDA